MAPTKKKPSGPDVPGAYNWSTTDEQEVARRRKRALDESFSITNTEPQFPIFSTFRVKSDSGLVYAVEVRDVRARQFACTCVDFRINGLGTCKHVEAVLNLLEVRHKRLYRAAAKRGSDRMDVVVDAAGDTLRLVNATKPVLRRLNRWFEADGFLRNGDFDKVAAAVERLRAAGLPGLRVSQEVDGWIEARRRAGERKRLRREYELRVQEGEWPVQETLVPLFPYQREGMLHLAFVERGLLADEMGLGKTIQAIAAAALLHRLGQAKRVLVVTPASLKSEWEEQIRRFTPLPYQLIYGVRSKRLAAYATAPFFTIVNYEQMRMDALEVNDRLKPDLVVLDEAQRIKNWSTKTSQAIKRLRSRYAFILTGTPIENRIDELYSLMDFLDPTLLGPLFRFNREYYELDERGRPSGYRNLDRLHDRIRPYMLRRRKADVETELPERTDRNHFVALSGQQQTAYDGFEAVVAKLVAIAKRRPLTAREQDRLMRNLAMMRMVCDTNFILDPEEKECPKLEELERVLEECRENDAKVIVFSEWERMLQLARGLCDDLSLGYAWHTGSVPQKRRRGEINAFKDDPECRVFLSTDSGASGLNLQNASVVVNCDLPWNPAKLEQRIARAWRKHQTRPVTVINLVSEKTIEHRMLATLADKQSLADGVLDRVGDLKEVRLRSGRQAMVEKLQQLMPSPPEKKALRPQKPPLPPDRSQAFAEVVRQRMGAALSGCEERYPQEGEHSVLYVVAERDAATWREPLAALHKEYFADDPAFVASPVQLEVIDRATHEAIERLVAAGLVARTIRASRPLLAEGGDETRQPLSEEERQRIAEARDLAGRKLKLALLLGEGGFADEAQAPLREALLAAGRGLSLEFRLPRPDSLDQVALPPLAHQWGESLPAVRSFVSSDGDGWESVAKLLGEKLKATAK